MRAGRNVGEPDRAEDKEKLEQRQECWWRYEESTRRTEQSKG